MIRQLERLFATIRHLTLRQIGTRGLRVVQSRWRALRRTAALLPPAPPRRPHVPHWTADNGCGSVEQGREVAAGQFTFLNVRRIRPGWHEKEVSRLWRYNLHYFDYAADLAALAAAGERSTAFETFRELADSWIDGNQVMVGDGWHPYTVSLRIVNWCEMADEFQQELSSDCVFAARLLSSLYGQARFLAAHLEHDVRGNHLVKNLRALLWASLWFESAEARKWGERALGLLRTEVAEQVLSDGGHFERTPAYHVQVLGDLAATAEHLRRNGLTVEWLDPVVERMRQFLAAITPPTGRLPLLKDSAATTVEHSKGLRSRFLADSGFAVIRNDEAGDFLIADFGKVCPDYLPAHAHADLFSYELTIAGVPTVVDAGVYEYTAGVWRDWFRSTAAHNTVEVAGRNQSDVWASFRVGRRAKASDVRWIDSGEFIIVQGSHDGYDPISHRRTILAAPERRFWLFVDEIGPDAAAVRSFIHLHPAVSRRDLKLSTFGADDVREGLSWYSEEFGRKIPNRMLELTASAPVCFGYAISASANVEVTAGTGALDVVVDSMAFRLVLPRSGVPEIQ